MNQYVVVDLEMCKVPYSNRKKEFHGANETIQIGAVLLNEKYEVVDEFNTYVRPEFGSLDWFITNLTGITSKDLKSAPTMREWLTIISLSRSLKGKDLGGVEIVRT